MGHLLNVKKNIPDETVNLFSGILLKCLKYHLILRIESESKRDHWCWHWFEENIKRISHILLFFNYIKKDLICADSRTCLLNNPAVFVETTLETTKNIQGVYIHRDVKNEIWIRSGKVINRSMSKRIAEHTAGANNVKEGSRLYTAYPNKNNPIISHTLRSGYLHDLLIYVGIGFPIDNENINKKLTSRNGIFSWTTEIECKLGISKMCGNPSHETKKLHMVGYLIELAFNLYIPNHNNISTNPGFEGCHGCFNRNSD